MRGSESSGIDGQSSVQLKQTYIYYTHKFQGLQSCQVIHFAPQPCLNLAFLVHVCSRQKSYWK